MIFRQSYWFFLAAFLVLFFCGFGNAQEIEENPWLNSQADLWVKESLVGPEMIVPKIGISDIPDFGKTWYVKRGKTITPTIPGTRIPDLSKDSWTVE